MVSFMAALPNVATPIDGISVTEVFINRSDVWTVTDKLQRIRRLRMEREILKMTTFITDDKN